ncbi:RDD family protein [Fimbriiglobus ruber]|uniref:RDD domain containing protein n=1 Tax=Fimbriiglobus ruber TaxID=1908690 RepID=A0A225DYB3_9BACT|nr:RDD family protein [Fimbriiglobus ruber]OWK42239.1 RDD domain containing protein [Fimbriiglobus ruber]
MRWADEMRIETPEQIGVDLELSGLGSRFVAQIIDWFWKILFTLLLALVCGVAASLLGKVDLPDDPSVLLISVAVSLIYILWLGAGIYCETMWNGQTPGKRFAGIRVIRQGGGPIDARSACVRNFLAVADFLPGFYLLGALLILLTSNRQRLGDLAAGTIVVRERSAGAAPDEDEHLMAHASDAFRFSPTHLKALAPGDRAIIRSFLQRYEGMDPDGRNRLVFRMADGFVQKTGYVPTIDIDDSHTARAFLASLLRDLDELRRHA